ncbi:hypothetical protein FOA52_012541 [Chlamydomonas sp. UWO 241]|nr:hypothetical protein FOA52_012541 [Chlamydomonas sp. UWO 241]
MAADSAVKVTAEQLGINVGGRNNSPPCLLACTWRTCREEYDGQLEFDMGNLSAMDPAPLDPSSFSGPDKEAALLDAARRMTQSLANKLFTLPAEPTRGGRLALLPPPLTVLPRFQPMPKPIAMTKWEKFAQQKGITKRKRSKLVFDEQSQDWKRRHGYERANDELQHAIIEASDKDVPGEDPFARLTRERKERVNKNKKQQLDNVKEAVKVGAYLPTTVKLASSLSENGRTGGPTERGKRKHMKDEIKTAHLQAGVSTASMGKFDRRLKGERDGERNPDGKRRKFMSATDTGAERSKLTGFADKLIRERSDDILDMKKAMGKFDADEGEVRNAGRTDRTEGLDKPSRGGGRGGRGGARGGGRGGRGGSSDRGDRQGTAVMDLDGHGTHCAGTIAGVGNNSAGIAGVSWGAKLLGCRHGRMSWGYSDDVTKCIRWCREQGAKIMSASWGGSKFNDDLLDEMLFSEAAGVLFVVAAGNDGVDISRFPDYPSEYAVASVITVGAFNPKTDRVPHWSNYGARDMHLFSPGVDIYSTTTGEGNSTLWGTSMAVPHVAGAAALLWSSNRSLTAQQVKALLLNNVDVLPCLAGKCTTGGRLNVFKALKAAQGGGPTPDYHPPPAPSVDEYEDAGAYDDAYDDYDAYDEYGEYASEYAGSFYDQYGDVYIHYSDHSDTYSDYSGIYEATYTYEQVHWEILANVMPDF